MNAILSMLAADPNVSPALAAAIRPIAPKTYPAQRAYSSGVRHFLSQADAGAYLGGQQAFFDRADPPQPEGSPAHQGWWDAFHDRDEHLRASDDEWRDACSYGGTDGED